MPKVPEGKLTIKQKKFVKAYVANDGNGTKAALESYNTVDEKTASVIASENLEKPSVKEAIDAALDKHGITMDAAIAPIADGLTAFRTVPGGDGEGSWDVADHSIRLKASGMALKLLGAEKQSEIPQGANFIQVNNNYVDRYKD